jgi:hypothetical protein
MYAGGGGGCSYNGQPGAVAGLGGVGGGGAAILASTGTAGSTNTGGGGGGSGSGTGGAGGSGIVIIRYPNTFSDAISVSNGTKTTANGCTIYTFTTSGAITF